MKNIRFIIFGFVAITLLWTSCDKVDDGLKVVDIQDIPDKINDTVFFADSVFVDQKQVLLEDFTGHLCNNCPEAAIAAHGWIEDYDHRLVVYSVHAGYQAFPFIDPNADYSMDFTNPTSDEIFLHFDEPYNPTATVNRTEFDGSLILFFFNGDWESSVAEAMTKPNKINLKVKNTFYPKINSILINVTSTFVEPTSNRYKLVVMIAEDDIVAPQKNGDVIFGEENVPDWVDYVHRNVLRDAVSATFGSYITGDGTVIIDEPYESNFLYEIDENWVAGNCNIIAYIIEEETGEIIQVAQLGVKVE